VIHKMLAMGDVEGVFQMEGGTNRRVASSARRLATASRTSLPASCGQAPGSLPQSVAHFNRNEGDLITFTSRAETPDRHPGITHCLGRLAGFSVGKLGVGDDLSVPCFDAWYDSASPKRTERSHPRRSKVLCASLLRAS